MLTTSSSSLLPPKQPAEGRTMTYDHYLPNASTPVDGKVQEFLRPLPKHVVRYSNETKYIQSYGGDRMMGKYGYHSEAAATMNLAQKPPMHFYHAGAYAPFILPPSMQHQFSMQPSMPLPPPPGLAQQHHHHPRHPVLLGAPNGYYINEEHLRLKAKESMLPPPLPPQKTQQPPLEKPISFKVPSGKEGSLKHRILTRPEAEEAPAPSVPDDLSPAADPVLSASFGRTVADVGMTAADFGLRGSGVTAPWNAKKPEFSRGSLITMPNDKVIKIEDMRTEDFYAAAQVNPKVSLNPSTVVRIIRKEHAILILSHGQDQKRTTEMAVNLEQPVFVEGKGWASVCPEKTLLAYDLPCQPLSEGDTCIMMALRSEETTTVPPSMKRSATTPMMTATKAVRRRWSEPLENGSTDLDQDCPQPPAARRMKH